jgi:putative inorganic carbon (hco3(-)) transporter
MVFLGINLYFIIEEVYWVLFLPLALVVIALYFLSLDHVLLLIVFLTPLSVSLSLWNGSFGLSIPTEPLLIGVSFLFLLRLAYKFSYDILLLKHPLSVAIICYLFWMFITSISSEIPLVSFKFWASKIWFIIPFYFASMQIFRNINNIRLFSKLYVLSFLIIIAYTFVRHSQYGFSEESGHWVMTPSYNDHTAYGAMLAFFLPVIFGFFRYEKYAKSVRILSIIIGVVFLLSLFLSFSRAAWLSMMVAAVCGLLIVFKIKFKWIASLSIIIVASFFVFQNEIVQRLEKNTNESSENYIEHLRSIYNISSDASNLERINRWQSALRLFEERPIVGWGPGTYQFVYAAKQNSREKTIISTNAGDMGNAHSEYLGPLAEMGILGFLLMIAIVIIALYKGIKVYRQAVESEVKMLSLATVLALISYFTHGLINNFLDSDKAAIPVWGFMAMIVAMEVCHPKIESSKIEE